MEVRAYKIVDSKSRWCVLLPYMYKPRIHVHIVYKLVCSSKLCIDIVQDCTYNTVQSRCSLHFSAT